MEDVDSTLYCTWKDLKPYLPPTKDCLEQAAPSFSCLSSLAFLMEELNEH